MEKTEHTLEEKTKAFIKAFNEMMPDHLNIGIVPKWVPEHPAKEKK